MRTAPGTRRGRSGFTLIELLVVITIIAILIALTASAISLALGTAHRTRLRSEISELNKAMIAVQTEYNVKYIPSKIRLREDMAYGTPIDQLDTDSWNFLHAMWPRLTIGSGVDWNGDGTPNGPWVLEGEECLVFFTGGIPSNGSPNATLGFSTNPTNPAAPVTGGTRKGPYFPFDSSRLIRSPSPTATNFLRYGDPMTGTPYAYFSSFSYWTKISVGSLQVPVANRYGPTGAAPVGGAGVSDCNSLGVSPYADVAPNPTATPAPIPHYLNNDTFQIISAGADGVFGQGSMNNSSTSNCSWSPGTAGTTNATTDASGANAKAGKDDMANFYDNLLGIAP